MEKVPGLLRLGISGTGSQRVGPGFKVAIDTNNHAIPIETALSASMRGVANAFEETKRDGPAGFTATRPAVEPFVPPKFKYAGQKLTFKGYFHEAVPESRTETWRTRRLVLVYHLEDDTLEVLEPEVRNAGIPAGRFLKRMKVPSISVDTLRVGGKVGLYDRVIALTACDEYTRKYYASLGKEQEPDVADEVDPWTETQIKAAARLDPESFHGVKSSAITRFIEAEKGSGRTTSFKKDIKARFLEYDGQVLRFLVLWDDTKYNMFGEKYLFWLSYYLATEQVDIKEVKGKKRFMGWSTLLRRGRLPKFVLAHDDRMRSVEDVTGDEDYYNENDFIVGNRIRVYGRDMTICDCDDFTAEWYAAHKGVDQRARRIDTSPPPPPKSPKKPESLIPRPKPDDRAMHKVPTGKTVKYMARLVTDDPIDAERVFRITIYEDDEHVSVFEPPIRNSGLKGGTWLKKRRLVNPDKSRGGAQVFFTPADFCVGATVTLKGHQLTIHSVEPQPAEKIPTPEEIIFMLKKKMFDASSSLRKMFRKFDSDKSQTISFQEFCDMLAFYSLGLSKYDAIVLFKVYEDKPGFMSYSNFMKAFTTSQEVLPEGTMLTAEDEAFAARAREIGAITSKDELEAMIEEVKQAAVDAEEETRQEILCAQIARAFKNSKTAQQVHSNFRRFDLDHNHTVDKGEFRAVMGPGGMNLAPHDVETLMSKFYPPGEEELDYEHFMRVIHEYADKVIRSM